MAHTRRVSLGTTTTGSGQHRRSLELRTEATLLVSKTDTTATSRRTKLGCTKPTTLLMFRTSLYGSIDTVCVGISPMSVAHISIWKLDAAIFVPAVDAAVPVESSSLEFLSRVVGAGHLEGRSVELPRLQHAETLSSCLLCVDQLAAGGGEPPRHSVSRWGKSYDDDCPVADIVATSCNGGVLADSP